MAAARWAMWRASKGPERERMSPRPEGRAFVISTAESELNEEVGGLSDIYPAAANVPVGVAF
jgi:hypothetical protein